MPASAAAVRLHEPLPQPERPALLVDAREAARLLAVSERTVWQLTHDGDLPCIRIGRRSVRYSPEDLARYVARQRQIATTEIAHG